MAGIEITTKIGCRNACVYCPQDALIKAYRARAHILEMSFDVFKACLDKIPSEVDVHFCGMCEPWLNPECTDMVLYAYKKGHKIFVLTTLTGMNLSDVDLLKTCSFEMFDIHLPSENGFENIKIDDQYLEVLEKISKSNINATYHTHAGATPPAVRQKMGEAISILPLISRVAHFENMSAFGSFETSASISAQNRKRGVISCTRNLSLPVLLPNGDVVLCCMDYGLKHVLGNLISEDYNSLFRSAEFLKVKKGLRDESLDILCRYCDGYADDLDASAKIYNYYLPRVKRRLKEIRNSKDVFKLIKDCLLFLVHFIRKRVKIGSSGRKDGEAGLEASSTKNKAELKKRE